MRKSLLSIALLLSITATIFSQKQTVTGTVLSAEDNVPMPGVTILIKGSSVGTNSNIDGKFSIACLSKDVLVFTFVGMTPVEIPVGSQSMISVKMKSDIMQLNEVVVTALGVQRDKKALGFSQQQLKGESVTEARSPNVANGLSGKIAGFRINTSSGPGSAATIQIRGSSSVSGNNQPLVVIDGVPIQQTFDKQFGSGLSEVSPDNIKDIAVLKGPNAAALYGSRAANGVILITTKNGSGTKGIGVEINSNVTADRPFISPNFQNTYGGGNGYRTWYNDGWSGSITDPTEIAQYRAVYGPNAPLGGTEGTDESWGAPMDGRLVRQWWTGKEVAPLTPQPNNFQEFWQTGTAITNNVAISGGNEKGNFRLSFGKLDQKGIMYFNDFQRNNFKLNTGYNFTPKLNVTMSAEYIKSWADNRGYVSGQEFIWAHRHISWEQLRNWKDYTSVHIQRAVAGRLPDSDPPHWQHTFFTNPYFIQEKLPSSNDKDRLVGNIALNYKILPSLSLMLRTGTDVWSDTRINVVNFERVRNGNRTPGRFSEDVLRRQETNTDAILTYNGNLTKDLSLTAQAGGIVRTNLYKRNYLFVGELVIDGLYNAGNAVPSQNTIQSTIQKQEVQSAFGSVNLGYKNAIFLDLTARNDWSSTLPAGNRSYFYPSASMSFVLTDLIQPLRGNILSFAKARVSLAQVGNDADPYQLAQTYRAGTSWNGSVPEFFENTTIANSSLKPEITTGFEAGLDLRLFKGKVNLDLTYYEQNTSNQILGVEISKASGYNTRILNAGQISNSGVEVTVSGTPLKLENGLTWEIGFNFARNRNKVVELAEGLTTYILNERRGLTSEARVGQPYGTLYGYGFERSPDGQLIMVNGLPQLSTSQKILGNVQPDWIGGFTNTFSFKNFSLSTLIDIRMGGSIYDEGTANARWTGQYAETAIGREEGVIGKGVKAISTNPDGSKVYVPNDIVVSASQYYGYNNPRRYHEAAIFDGSYVKLREVAFGYKLPTALVKKVGFQSAKISLVGRNVLMLFKNHPHQDPEIDANGGNRQGFGYGELPSTRSLGANLSLSF
jgi:TonB-linked SusC/RagA family outer membrane protein